MKKIDFYCILKATEDFGTDPDPLVRGAGPRIRIRIRTNMSRIWYTVFFILTLIFQGSPVPGRRCLPSTACVTSPLWAERATQRLRHQFYSKTGQTSWFFI
jgi:hypothetical protein